MVDTASFEGRVLALHCSSRFDLKDGEMSLNLSQTKVSERIHSRRMPPLGAPDRSAAASPHPTTLWLQRRHATRVSIPRLELNSKATCSVSIELSQPQLVGAAYDDPQPRSVRRIALATLFIDTIPSLPRHLFFVRAPP